MNRRGAKPSLLSYTLLPSAASQLPVVFRLTLGNRLPVHVARRVRTAAGQRDNVIDDIAAARPVRAPVAGQGCRRVNSALALALWIVRESA